MIASALVARRVMHRAWSLLTPLALLGGVASPATFGATTDGDGGPGPQVPNAYRPWTDAEDRQLVELVSGGGSASAIGAELGRSKGAVFGRLKKLGVGLVRG